MKNWVERSSATRSEKCKWRCAAGTWLLKSAKHVSMVWAAAAGIVGAGSGALTRLNSDTKGSLTHEQHQSSGEKALRSISTSRECFLRHRCGHSATQNNRDARGNAAP